LMVPDCVFNQSSFGKSSFLRMYSDTGSPWSFARFCNSRHCTLVSRTGIARERTLERGFGGLPIRMTYRIQISRTTCQGRIMVLASVAVILEAFRVLFLSFKPSEHISPVKPQVQSHFYVRKGIGIADT
jgi:hypothetical protein